MGLLITGTQHKLRDTHAPVLMEDLPSRDPNTCPCAIFKNFSRGIVTKFSEPLSKLGGDDRNRPISSV